MPKYCHHQSGRDVHIQISSSTMCCYVFKYQSPNARKTSLAELLAASCSNCFASVVVSLVELLLLAERRTFNFLTQYREVEATRENSREAGHE